jgi:hypothetical protein
VTDVGGYADGVDDLFRLGNDELGVDQERSSVTITDGHTVAAEVYAAAVPAGASQWALSPPLLYFRAVRLVRDRADLTLTVDDHALDEHDIALYFVEHHDVHGTLTVREGGTLTFHGTTPDSAGRAVPLTVSLRTPPRPA